MSTTPTAADSGARKLRSLTGTWSRRTAVTVPPDRTLDGPATASGAGADVVLSCSRPRYQTSTARTATGTATSSAVPPSSVCFAEQAVRSTRVWSRSPAPVVIGTSPSTPTVRRALTPARRRRTSVRNAHATMPTAGSSSSTTTAWTRRTWAGSPLSVLAR
jgi:hypothetical protein